MTAREKFSVGQRVKSCSGKPRFGVVAGFCRDSWRVKIRVEGNEHPQIFHMDSWEAESKTEA